MPGALLAVASTGGHLNELHHLLPRLRPAPDHVEWVTFDTPQSRSLLDGERVHYVRATPTRSPVAVAANLRPALGLLRTRRFSGVVSTGAGVALSFLPAAGALRIPAHYIESATRLDGPSTTGRILARTPGVHTYTQEERWAGPRWLFRGSVFEGFEPDDPGVAPATIRRAVVVLGTNPYSFPRLVERLVELLPQDAETIWQTGVTPTAGLGIDAREHWPARELHAAMAEADVVVAHAGIGAALAALESGRIPVLVPRLSARGEQVDDHQVVIAGELEERGLAITSSPDDLTLDTLLRAAGLRARPRPEAAPFALEGS